MKPTTTESTQMITDAAREAERFREVFSRLREQIGKLFVGHDELVENVLSVLLSGGHVLIEGVPGLGKTLLVRTLAAAVGVEFSRIQFTPDLMPSDITGTMALHEKPGGGHEFRFEPGPLIANVVLADEINRATPKTQSALLEAMQEQQVSVARRTIPLPEPFIVLATQNPIEHEGTYPLPEAQLDRFQVKLLVSYPSEREYLEIVARTTGTSSPAVSAVTTGPEIMHMREITRAVPASEQVTLYATRLVMATQPGSPHAPARVSTEVALGASPRGVQALILLGKVRALLGGRFAVSCKDVRDVALPVLRHRILLSFEAQANSVEPDAIVREAVNHVSEFSET
jgi:MoxR-like ATPase